MRIMKVLKSSDRFSSLFLLYKSLIASRQALVWSVLLLLTTMTCFGMLMNQLMYTYLADNRVSLTDRREVFEYFGTFSRTLITMFELTIGNWAPPTRVLMAKVGEGWGLFVVAYRGLLCFALVNVTAAVFITETNRVASSDDEVMMMQKQRMQRSNSKKLKDVFHELDDSGDGFVSWDEFELLLQDDLMRQFLATLELEVGDLEELFRLLDSGEGQVDCQEFIKGINSIRGQAKNIDLRMVLKLVKKINASVEQLQADLSPDKQDEEQASDVEAELDAKDEGKPRRVPRWEVAQAD
eukprot:CAMPEP_0171260668 /NCGR_PEP_ID=MMETSP0790-20130122/55574_1 /TAXON_ID=2925 /ORGANISM="Alexandrium catenella, Strain OF101" /LENGTH=295 /DNA_ID=CAMNT_0011729005 /DNA_START=9 /DNA_END=895 /DNA_ORIENTATION=-